MNMADPTLKKWTTKMGYWKKVTNASALNKLYATSSTRPKVPVKTPKKLYKYTESDSEDESDKENSGDEFSDPRDTPDHLITGHADYGLPPIAGKQLWGLHAGTWLFSSAYPLRLLLRASASDLAIDFAGFCPKLETKNLTKDKWDSASSADEGEKAEREGDSDDGSDDDDSDGDDGIMSDMFMYNMLFGGGGSRGGSRKPGGYRSRAARQVVRAGTEFRASAVYRLRIPTESLHAASLFAPPAAGKQEAGAVLALDLLRPPAFLSRRPRDADPRGRAFRPRGDFTPGAAASACPRILVLGALAELTVTCQRACAASPAFRAAWERGADPALDPAPGAYPAFLAPREGLTVEALAGMSDADLRAALQAASPQPMRLRPSAPRAALLSLASALVPRPAAAVAAAAPPKRADDATRREMVQVLVRRGLLAPERLGPDGLPPVEAARPGPPPRAMGPPPERDNGLRGACFRDLNGCFADFMNHCCEDAGAVEGALDTELVDDPIRFPESVPKEERRSTVGNLLKYGSSCGSYYSFCEGELVSEECSWHCRACRACRDRKQDHCRWCGQCYHSGGVTRKCSKCGANNEKEPPAQQPAAADEGPAPELAAQIVADGETEALLRRAEEAERRGMMRTLASLAAGGSLGGLLGMLSGGGGGGARGGRGGARGGRGGSGARGGRGGARGGKRQAAAPSAGGAGGGKKKARASR